MKIECPDTIDLTISTCGPPIPIPSHYESLKLYRYGRKGRKHYCKDEHGNKYIVVIEDNVVKVTHR